MEIFIFGFTSGNLDGQTNMGSKIAFLKNIEVKELNNGLVFLGS